MENEKKVEKKNSGLAIAGFVLAIIALLSSLIPIINNMSFLFAIVGLVLAIIPLFKKNVKKGLAIAAVIIAVISMVLVFASQKVYGDALDEVSNELNDSFSDADGTNTDDILENDLDVSIGNINITVDEYGLTDSYLTVTIKNKSNEKFSGSVSIEALDENGTRIDTDDVYIDSLDAGQTQEFKIFTYISSDEVEKMKTATFKAYSVSKY